MALYPRESNKEMLTNKKVLSAGTLKNIAVITMVIDHLGATLVYEFEQKNFQDIGIDGFVSMWMRIIGRIAFVLFAFLLTEGFVYTSSKKKYALRLCAGAVISEIPYDLVESGEIVNIWAQNIFFTLLLGFCIIWILDSMKENSIFVKVLVVLLGLVLSEMLCCEYGVMGIGLIVAFYCLRGKMILYPVILVECFIGHLVNDLVHNLVTINQEMIRNGSGIYLFSWNEMSLITKVNFERRLYQTMPGILVALILIFFYSKKKGKQLPKAFYYMFYPVHLIAIFFLMKIFF